MVVRKFKKSKFDAFYDVLMEHAQIQPYEAGCIVDLTANGEQYALKLLPEPNQVAILQAVHTGKGAQPYNLELITHNGFLLILFELLLYQWTHE